MRSWPDSSNLHLENETIGSPVVSVAVVRGLVSEAVGRSGPAHMDFPPARLTPRSVSMAVVGSDLPFLTACSSLPPRWAIFPAKLACLKPDSLEDWKLQFDGLTDNCVS